VRLELERSGGLAGRTVRWSLDTTTLPGEEATAVADLAAHAATWGRPPAPGADRFHYRLRVLDAAPPVDVSFGEPGPAEARALLDRLRQGAPEPA
jgi:hypothetical protein